MKNSYTKFKVNISKNRREKSGKLKSDNLTDWLTDRQIDGEQTKIPPGKRVGD